MEPGRDATAVELDRWPLVGRDDELALATTALVETGSVVLTGAAGVGKTRLARCVLANAANPGDRTEWVAATQAAASVPLGCVAHLMPSDAIREGREATLRAVVAALARATTKGRVLLGVDDAHLLDDASAALVHLLAMTGTAAVVVTVRSGEQAPDSIVALWKDGSAPTIALQALAQSEVEAVVADALDGPIEGATLHYLWESSRGNALYLRELVRHGIESGALLRERGLWHWPGRRDAGERLHDLVALRMGTLAENERATLELVTVGEPLSTAALRFLGVTETAEKLERRGLVMSDPNVRETSLAHPLFGEVVRHAMPATRHDDVRLRLADACEATSTNLDADQLRITLWRLDGGDRSRPEELVSAAFRALQLWDVDITERLARAALESGPDFEAGMMLAGAMSRRGETERALEAYVALHDVASDDPQVARLAIVEASVRFFHLGQSEEAHRILADAITRVTDEQARQRLLSQMRLLGHPLEQDLTQAEHQDVLSALGGALECLNAGRLQLAVHTVDTAFATFGEELERDPIGALFLLNARTWARLFEGAVESADGTASREYTAAVSRRADYPRVVWCMTRGRIAILRGRVREAVHALQEGVVLMGSDDRGYQRPMRAYLAMAAAMTGDVKSARDHARQADEASRILDGTLGVEVACAQAAVLACQGELTAAIAACAVAADDAASRGQSLGEAIALHDLARYGRAGDAAVRLGQVSVSVDGPLVEAFAVHARGLADDDGLLLDAASTRFADLAATLFAAEASSAAATAHRRNGMKASAFASRERARELVEACEDPRTPMLVGLESVDDLTSREREVAELAASGLSSRRVAERLGIAVRTVDNLLGRVYAKLDVSGREELTDLLGTTKRR